MDHSFISYIIQITQHRKEAYTHLSTFQYVHCITVFPLTHDGFWQIRTYTGLNDQHQEDCTGMYTYDDQTVRGRRA